MSPRSTEQFEKMRSATIAKIRSASLELFVEKGYRNTSVAEIAKRANISKGLIYNYYKSKEEVLESVLSGFLQMEKEVTKEGESSLLEMLDQYFLMLENQSGFVKMILSFSLDVNDLPIVKQFIHAKTERGIKMMQNLLAKSNFKNPETEAWYLTSLLEGTALLAIVAQEEFPLDQMKKEIYKRYKIN